MWSVGGKEGGRDGERERRERKGEKREYCYLYVHRYHHHHHHHHHYHHRHHHLNHNYFPTLPHFYPRVFIAKWPPPWGWLALGLLCAEECCVVHFQGKKIKFHPVILLYIPRVFFLFFNGFFVYCYADNYRKYFTAGSLNVSLAIVEVKTKRQNLFLIFHNDHSKLRILVYLLF